MDELKTRISDIPVCNEKLYKEIARISKTSEEEIKKMYEFTTRYIVDIMKKDEMEAVMLPYFGKFRPKVKKLKAMKQNQTNLKNGMNMLVSAIKGNDVKDYREKHNSTNDEII